MKRREIFVGPDEYRVSADESEVLVALGIGSCIVGILYDPFRKIGGMIHVMRLSAGEPTISTLLQEMEGMGALRPFIQARIVGGARILTGNLDAGEKNIEINRRLLARERVPIIYEDVGDSLVRSVRFSIRDGKLSIKRLKRNERPD